MASFSDIPSDWLWIIIVGFIISFVLAVGIGANDVANSFGTSVGSKVLTLFKACILASIFEVLGAILIGYRVSDTIRKGIVDVSPYNNSEKLLLLGNLSALTGSCIWLFLATALRLPVSATHSIVGATIGFSLVAQGSRGVGWVKLGLIVASWFVSPLLSGIISALLFILIRKLVLSKAKPLEPGLRLLPLFYGATILINAISIFLDGSELLHFDKIPIYGAIILSVGLGVITAIIVRLFIVPWMRKKILESKDETPETGVVEKERLDVAHFAELEITVEERENEANGDATFASPPEDEDGEKLHNGDAHKEPTSPKEDKNGCTPGATAEAADSRTALISSKNGVSYQPGSKLKLPLGSETPEAKEQRERSRATIHDSHETGKLFAFLQILTAVFGAFAHGGNDVSNAIGPLVGLWVIGTEQSVSQKAPTPIWILLFGGVGISLGLCLLGRRVIKTMGEDLSKVTPSSGFCIELGAAFTVLVASNAKIPVSTTHCKVGSIVAVGRVRSNDNVDWSLFRNIFGAWVVTLPASGLLSAGMMWLLQEVAL